jgi:hypothetical protein
MHIFASTPKLAHNIHPNYDYYNDVSCISSAIGNMLNNLLGQYSTYVPTS